MWGYPYPAYGVPYRPVYPVPYGGWTTHGYGYPHGSCGWGTGGWSWGWGGHGTWLRVGGGFHGTGTHITIRR